MIMYQNLKSSKLSCPRAGLELRDPPEVSNPPPL